MMTTEPLSATQTSHELLPGTYKAGTHREAHWES